MHELEIRDLESICDFHGCPDIFDLFYHEVCESLKNIDESSELVEKCYQAALEAKDPRATIRTILDGEIKKTITQVIDQYKSLLSHVRNGANGLPLPPESNVDRPMVYRP